MSMLMEKLGRVAQAGQRAGGVKTIVAAMAVAWGTSTIQKVALDANEQTKEATDRYAEVMAELARAKAELAQAHAETETIVALVIDSGRVDELIERRAIQMGWMKPLSGSESAETLRDALFDAEEVEAREIAKQREMNALREKVANREAE